MNHAIRFITNAQQHAANVALSYLEGLQREIIQNPSCLHSCEVIVDPIYNENEPRKHYVKMSFTLERDR